MSQENVDAVIENTEAVNRRDIPGILRIADPEIRYEPRAAELEGGYVGPEGVREFFEGIWENFEVFQAELQDVRDLGDRVLAAGTLTMRGKGSGIHTEEPIALVLEFRDGLVIHSKDYGEKELALKAVGLKE